MEIDQIADLRLNDISTGAKTSDAISALSSSIRGSMQYLLEKPSALLMRSTSILSENSKAIHPFSSTIVPADLEGVTLGEEDLATYLLPRILRATSSLEAALLSSEIPNGDNNDDSALLFRARQKLRDQLEDLLAKIIGVLTESAIGVEWKGKYSPVEGGIGKGREMTSSMIKVLEGKLYQVKIFSY